MDSLFLEYSLKLVTDALILVEDGYIIFRNPSWIDTIMTLSQGWKESESNQDKERREMLHLMLSRDLEERIPLSSCYFPFLSEEDNHWFQEYAKETLLGDTHVDPKNKYSGFSNPFRIKSDSVFGVNDSSYRERYYCIQRNNGLMFMVSFRSFTAGKFCCIFQTVRDQSSNSCSSANALYAGSHIKSKVAAPSPIRSSAHVFFDTLNRDPAKCFFDEPREDHELSDEELLFWYKLADEMAPQSPLWSFVEWSDELGLYRHCCSKSFWLNGVARGLDNEKLFHKLSVRRIWNFSGKTHSEWNELYQNTINHPQHKLSSEFIFAFPTGPRRLQVTIRFLGYSKYTKDPIFFNVYQDITEERKVEQEELRQKNELIELMGSFERFYTLNPLVMGLAEIDEDGTDVRLIHQNTASQELTKEHGYPVAKGKCLMKDLQLEPFYVSRWIEMFKESEREMKPINFQTPRLNRFLNCFAICLGGGRFAFILQDITDSKALEKTLISCKESLEETVLQRTKQLEDALAVKSRFLAMMSHEIRTPLFGVMASLSLLSEDPALNANQQESVRIGLICGEQLLFVINDILDFSKMEENKLKLESYPFSLVETLEESLEVVSQEADRKRLDLLWDVNELDQEIIMGDKSRLRQVLVNLLSNAAKFSKQGEIVVTVQTLKNSAEEEDDSCTILFSVKDEGIGIGEEVQSKLFQPFHQADTSTTRKFGGSGLGLSICYRLTELMGGKMWFTSKENSGSTFFFTIKTSKSPISSPQILPLYLNSNPSVKKKTVAVVSKSHTLWTSLSHVLNRWNMKPLYFKDCFSAVKGAKDIDLFLLDSNGFTADEINTIEPHKLYIIGHRGQSKEGSIVLKKPLRISLLHSLLNKGEKSNYKRQRQHRGEASQQHRFSSARVLVAEDNNMNQIMIKKVLEKIGFTQITIVENGRKAIEAVQTQSPPFDLILMDVMMPEMGGIEATQFILQSMGLQHKPSIIALTADAFAENKEKCIAAGMSDVLTKPIQQTQLIQVLNEQLKIHSSPLGEESP